MFSQFKKMLFAVVNMYLAFSNLTENVNPNCNVLIACPGGGGGAFHLRGQIGLTKVSRISLLTSLGLSLPF